MVEGYYRIPSGIVPAVEVGPARVFQRRPSTGPLSLTEKETSPITLPPAAPQQTQCAQGQQAHARRLGNHLESASNLAEPSIFSKSSMCMTTKADDNQDVEPAHVSGAPSDDEKRPPDCRFSTLTPPKLASQLISAYKPPMTGMVTRARENRWQDKKGEETNQSDFAIGEGGIRFAGPRRQITSLAAWVCESHAAVGELLSTGIH